jgi:hypothetical protein
MNFTLWLRCSFSFVFFGLAFWDKQTEASFKHLASGKFMCAEEHGIMGHQNLMVDSNEAGVHPALPIVFPHLVD